MSWLDCVAVSVLEKMIRMAWHRVLGRISKNLTRLVRQKLGENMPPSNKDIEVGLFTLVKTFIKVTEFTSFIIVCISPKFSAVGPQVEKSHM